MPHRYFTTEISNGTATLRGADAHHLSRVMRGKLGDTVILCDGNAVEYTATITGFGPETVEFSVEPGYPSAAEPSVEVTLFVGYPKQDKLEQVIRHGVELGCTHFVPFFSRYCVAAPKKEEQKNERYNRIALEAAKQCGRGVLPDVALPLPNFGALCRSLEGYDLVLFCYELGGAPLRQLLADAQPADGQRLKIALITGAEGGFAAEEAEMAAKAGAKTVGLGPRILRCETAPLAVLSAMRECGEYHITVKGGKYLEALAKADTIVFDKTGTLTRATPQVVQIVPFSGCGEQEVLQLAACLEEHFPHSMANAVVRAAKERGISHEEMHSEVEYIVAHGIASRVGGKRVVIGSAHFIFEDEGCTIPAGEQAKFDGLDPQYSHLYLAASGVLVGVICIADPLRPEAAQVLRQLQKLGITQTVMMTGDSDRTARAIAAQVGVDRCFAEVLPEDKAAFVRDAKAEGHTVVMIGDGINDSPALSAADIGIAIHSGAAIAREIADVTIRADSLEELVTLKAIANALQKRVGSNYRFVLSFNSALILLGALGILPPATSAMLHNLSTLGISLRSMTDLLEQKPSL